MKKLASFVFALMLACMALSMCAEAQELTARIRGTVTDPTGAGVPGAEVKAINTDTQVTYTVSTGVDGSFQFLQLPVGSYDVAISKQGFRTFTARHIVLVLNQVYALAVPLEVGQLSETVTVEGNAIQVESTVTQLGTVMESQKIVDLPLIGRDWTQLQQLVPGVVAGSDRFGTVARGNAYASNGSQSQQNSFLIDGADSTDIAINTPAIVPSPDAIQEFNFVTNTINPEYGRNSGGILNAVLKSGSNAFHGDAFEFFRDTSLNDPNFFRTPNVFHQNNYGGTLGGPIRKDKTFFFISYEGARNRAGISIPGGLPVVFSQNQRNGIFSDIASSTTKSPFPLVGENGQTFPAGTPYNEIFPTGHIPGQDFNSISQKLLTAYVPLPNQPGNIYSYAPVQVQTRDQGIAKIDQHFGDRDALWVSAFFDDEPRIQTFAFGGATLPGFPEADNNTYKTFTMSWTHTFSPTMLNEFRAAYVRINMNDVNPVNVVQPSTLGFTGINPQSVQSASVPSISLNGYFSLGFATQGPQPRVDENYQLTDSLSKVIGSHTLKFGFTGKRLAVSNPFFFRNNGLFQFNGAGQYSTGDPAADFLLGIPDSYNQTSGGHQVERTYEYYMYAQDSWKVNNELTLNYGVGYQIETPLQNKYFGGIALNCFRPGEQSSVFPTAPEGLVFPGDPGCSPSGYNTHYDNLGPRLGFAYSPGSGWLSGGSSHKFVVRGGFGVYFNRSEEELALQNLLSPPFGESSGGIGDVGGSPSFVNPFTDIATGQSIPNKFPFTPPKPGSKVDFTFFEPMSLNVVDPHFTAPYAMNYNLNVQRELPGAMVLQIGYVGAQGRHLEVAYEGNPITAAGAAECAGDPNCIGRRIFQQFYYPTHTAYVPGNIIASAGTQGTIGVSSYNSLQVSLNKRLSHGLSFQLGYVLSHSIDDGSGYEESSSQAASNPRAFNNYNATLSRGDSAFDARHRFVASYDYELPHVTRWSNTFVKYGLNGWRLSGITTFQTGFPFTPFDSGLRSLFYSALNYYGQSDGPNGPMAPVTTLDPRNANLVNTVTTPGNTASLPNYWFNPNGFTRQTFGMFGTSGRNSIHGPGINNTDLSLAKEVRFTETRMIQLRLEAYNLFNHAQFALPASDIASPTFGRIFSATHGRLVQLGAKLYF